jgi:hypothetical protein
MIRRRFLFLAPAIVLASNLMRSSAKALIQELPLNQISIQVGRKRYVLDNGVWVPAPVTSMPWHLGEHVKLDLTIMNPELFPGADEMARRLHDTTIERIAWPADDE